MSTKIHALVEGLGQLNRFTLTGGEVNDVTQAEALIEGITAGAIIADKAFDADALLARIHASGAKAVIPARAHRLITRRLDRRRYRNAI